MIILIFRYWPFVAYEICKCFLPPAACLLIVSWVLQREKVFRIFMKLNVRFFLLWVVLILPLISHDLALCGSIEWGLNYRLIPPTSFFLFKIVLTILVPLSCYLNFSTILSISTNTLSVILIKLFKANWISNWDDLLSLLCWVLKQSVKWYFFCFIYILFDFFHQPFVVSIKILYGYFIRFMLTYFILEGEGNCHLYSIFKFQGLCKHINIQKCSRFLYAYLMFCKLANFPFWLRSFSFSSFVWRSLGIFYVDNHVISSK